TTGQACPRRPIPDEGLAARSSRAVPGAQPRSGLATVTASATGETVAGRVARGASAAFVRTLVVYVATAVAMLVLTRRLTPREFGVYAVLVSVSAIAYYLVTAGFAFAFTRSESVEDEVVRAAFWCFETLYLAVAAVLGVVSLL